MRVLVSDIDCHEYLDDAEASAKHFRNGYFYPRDIVVRQADRRIRILGRAADVVILNAQKVATSPIEQAIQNYLRVDEVCLFSGLSEKGDKEIVVAIRTDRTIEREQLATAAGFVPAENVRFSIRKEFPGSETGQRKTQRGLLKKLAFKDLNGN